MKMLDKKYPSQLILPVAVKKNSIHMLLIFVKVWNYINNTQERAWGMTRRQRIVMGCIGVGSLLYIIVIQMSMLFAAPPAEPTSPEFRKLCSTNLQRTSSYGSSQAQEDPSLPVLYIITPTYKRPEMAAELTRLGQTLLLVPRVHWILAEDSHSCSDIVSNFLINLGLPYTHIASPMPDPYRRLNQAPRGVSNRRAALQWVKDHGSDNGVLYFLDDDNAIDVRLFEEMRNTKKVSMWPVGLIGDYSVSSPIVNDEGLVVGFYDAWPAGRKFQVDMAGFAVNTEFLKKQKKVSMPYVAGHEEDGFLKSLHISMGDIEVKANKCTEILVWHTRTTKNVLHSLNLSKHMHDNIKQLAHFMKSWGIIK